MPLGAEAARKNASEEILSRQTRSSLDHRRSHLWRRHSARAQSRRDPVVNAPPAIVSKVFTFMKALRKLDPHYDIPVMTATAKDPGTSEVQELNETVGQVMLNGACDISKLDRNLVQMVINVKIKRQKTR